MLFQDLASSGKSPDGMAQAEMRKAQGPGGGLACTQAVGRYTDMHILCTAWRFGHICISVCSRLYTYSVCDSEHLSHQSFFFF